MINYSLMKRESVSRLTGNEKKTLRLLLENSRMSDVEIGEKLKMSAQGANKIRKKLEDMGIINEYVAEIDYAALGITTFALILIDASGEEKLGKDIIGKMPSENIISLHRVVRNGISHIALCGFKDVYELDKYFNSSSFQNEGIKIKKIYVFPIQKLIKHSSKSLMDNLVKNFGKDNQIILPKMGYYEKTGKNLSKVRLTSNERRVLKELLKNGRARYNEIAKGLKGFTNRTASNVKDRLEEKKVVKGYTADLDMKKLGVNLLAFFFVKTKPDYWKYKEGFYKWINSSPNIIGGYHLNEENLHVIHAAFKNLGELEEYSHQFHNLNNDFFDIDQIYVTSPKGIIKNSPKELFVKLL